MVIAPSRGVNGRRLIAGFICVIRYTFDLNYLIQIILKVCYRPSTSGATLQPGETFETLAMGTTPNGNAATVSRQWGEQNMGA